MDFGEMLGMRLKMTNQMINNQTRIKIITQVIVRARLVTTRSLKIVWTQKIQNLTNQIKIKIMDQTTTRTSQTKTKIRPFKNMIKRKWSHIKLV